MLDFDLVRKHEDEIDNWWWISIILIARRWFSRRISIDWQKDVKDLISKSMHSTLIKARTKAPYSNESIISSLLPSKCRRTKKKAHYHSYRWDSFFFVFEKDFSRAICDLEQSVRLLSSIEDPMQEISSQRKWMFLSSLSIQIVPQAAAMSDRADKMKMVSKLPTSTGMISFDRLSFYDVFVDQLFLHFLFRSSG